MAVYSLMIEEPIEFITKNNLFVSYFSEEETEEILKMWSEYKKGCYFNSKTVRLESIKNNTKGYSATLSLTDFYSLMIYNIMPSQFEGFYGFVYEKYKENENSLFCADKLKDLYTNSINVNDFIDLINEGNMPNALAVSVLIRDLKGNVLLTKRTNNVGIGKNLYSVTATGAIDEIDLNSENPVVNAAHRELYEELNIDIMDNNFKFLGFVAGKNKKQPIALVDVIVQDVHDLIKDSCKGRDYDLEVDRLFVCNKKELINIVETCKFTEAAEFHLKNSL